MNNTILAVFIAIGFAAQTSAQQMPVPFAVCARSDTWTRPSPDVQSKIWSDNRYVNQGGTTAYEWTHNFLWTEPDTASIAYHSQNLSGLWTDSRQSQCPHRDPAHAWAEIWALNYHVAQITLDGLVYTLTVEPRKTGYEIIQFRRPGSLGASHATLRFVDKNGEVLDAWGEIGPSVFVPASRSG